MSLSKKASLCAYIYFHGKKKYREENMPEVMFVHTGCFSLDFLERLA